MRALSPGARVALSIVAVSLSALAIPVGSQALTRPPTPKGLPRVSTGIPLHVLGTSALLTASVNPEGKETSYYFQYGLTTAYGLQTPSASAGAAALRGKFGQPVSGLQPGGTYHYRVVAVNSAGTSLGRDRVFVTKGNKPRFVIPKPAVDVFGSPIIFSGTLAGFGGANHRIALQASPFPFLESFANIGSPGVTNTAGRFSFRVANLTSNTQLRVVTLDPLPIYSPVVTVTVAPRVTLRARSSGSAGLVRLYGTITPAVKGAKVLFQVLLPVRPGKNEETTRYVSRFSTGVKRGGQGFSRFSMVVKIRKGGRYRAYVKVRPGSGLVSGYSARTIVLHAAPGATRGHK
jgi:hypothetical protein